MALEPGTVVGDRYRLTRPLAKGGMATVWTALDQQLQRRVAVKFLSQEIAARDDVRARFVREGSADLDDPHIIKVYEYGVTNDDRPFIVMELLDGEDLGTRLAREVRLPASEVSDILTQVAAGLEVAHAAGIVHRDIKPDNIFVCHEDGEQRIKLVDFGIAKHTAVESYSVVTETGTMMGTPSYMSPEQVLTGSHVDKRSDLWSVGVVAYHALLGDVPFDGATLGALCVAITRGKYKAPSEHLRSLPEALDIWMQRALAVEPEDRFESADEMATTFRAAVEGVAPEPSKTAGGISGNLRNDTVKDAVTVINSVRTPKQNRWWVFVLVALVAAATGGLVAARFVPDRESQGVGPATTTAKPPPTSAVSTTTATAAVTASASATANATASASATTTPSATASASAPKPVPRRWRPAVPQPPPPKDRGF